MNEDAFIKKIMPSDNIYVYGAGMVGTLVLLRLRENGVSDAKIKFVVSRLTPGQTCLGVPVYGVEHCEWGENYSVIVATMPKNQKQIIDNLRKNGINEFIPVDDELYEDMERNYISAYIKSHKPIEGDRDVLFMSSDNNNTSGAFLCMVDLCLGMKDKGIKPFVVLPGYGNAEQMLRENNIEYTFVQSKSGLVDINEESEEPSMNFAAVQEIEKLINTHHIKLVHLNSTHTYVGALAAQKIAVPYIWHIRENITEQGLKIIDEDERYRLMNSSTRIITVSDYVGRCYPRLDQKRTFCIYDGVDAQKYYYEHDILNGDVIKILMPGIMVPLKGQHQLVKAAKGLMDSNIRFDVSFVGSGDADYIKMLEDEIDKYGLNDRVHIYGRTNNLDEWYRNTDIVVVCSRSEAFGRVTVEGQLSGCLVVGADCGATPELICDGLTGYLYELDNDEMLRIQILKACNDKEQTKLVAKQGQKQALEKFDKSLNCENVLREYKRILGDKLCG